MPVPLLGHNPSGNRRRAGRPGEGGALDAPQVGLWGGGRSELAGTDDAPGCTRWGGGLREANNEESKQQFRRREQGRPAREASDEAGKRSQAERSAVVAREGRARGRSGEGQGQVGCSEECSRWGIGWTAGEQALRAR